MQHIKQNGKPNCGQIAVAVLTGRPLEEIERYVGYPKKGTTTRVLAAAFARCHGWRCAKRAVVLRKQVLPMYALLVVRREKSRNWHWVAYANGVAYDGMESEPMMLADYQARNIENNYRITSFVNVEYGTHDRPELFDTGTTTKTTKGYPRVTAGPHRHKYVHRMIAAAMLGRELNRDEEVHHKNADKLDFAFQNLLVLGTTDHGWVSAKQAYYMRVLDIKAKKEWDTFMQEHEQQQAQAIAAAKAAGVPVELPPDGYLRQAWEAQHVEA